jgi:general secretion pathway protein L
MNTLTILIDERWPDSLLADWVLCGPRGAVLLEGSSEPRHWPAADRRVAVLAGAQVSLCALQLPASRRQDRERLIAYALEDRLPSETDGQHFTLLEQEGDRAIVAVVETERLRRLTEAFSGLGLPLSAAYARLQSLPRFPDTAVCVDEGAIRYWRWADGSGLVEDLSAGPESVSWIARASLSAVPATSVQGPESVAKALELPCRAEAVGKWHQLAPSANLLHGQFAPRERGGSRRYRLRWPLRLAGGALALHLCMGVGSAIIGRQSESQLDARAQGIFSAIFPGATIVDPVLQMRRQLNELRPRAGALRDDDLLILLAALSESLPADGRELIARLRYETGALELSLSFPLAEPERNALISALSMRGIEVGSAANTLLTLRRREA